MTDSDRKQNITKVYCEKCNIVFDSRTEYDKHYDKHSGGMICESCPLDTAISKLIGFFKNKIN
jgi:uncharacterized C2H2 Zn-finger protein